MPGSAVINGQTWKPVKKQTVASHMGNHQSVLSFCFFLMSGYSVLKNLAVKTAYIYLNG